MLTVSKRKWHVLPCSNAGVSPLFKEALTNSSALGEGANALWIDFVPTYSGDRESIQWIHRIQQNEVHLIVQLCLTLQSLC